MKATLEHEVIARMVTEGSSLLDLGCGDGTLLQLLVEERRVKGQGIEIDDEAVYRCVERGLDVIHGDIDGGLAEYWDGAFDLVILNQSLQQVTHFESVLNDALRVGARVIVGIPNMAHYRARLQLLAGRIPMTPSLPYSWFDSPNMHFVTITDFRDYCRRKEIVIEKEVAVGERRVARVWPNMFADVGVFLLHRP